MAVRTTAPAAFKRWMAFAAFVAAVGVAAVVWRRDPASPRANATAPETPKAPSSGPPIPSFERPEEAKRYFEAMIQGDTRAIEELDRALQQAKEKPDVTPAYVEQLERVRAERVERLEAHRAAQPR